MTARDTPGVIAPPPVIFLGFLIVGLALDALLPLPLRPTGIDSTLSWTTGAVLILLGLVTITLAIRNFMRAGTPVPTRDPTRALVTTGVHARSTSRCS
jgi:protein-S-isoprenylcysteine O-methyltransferase Ste14